MRRIIGGLFAILVLIIGVGVVFGSVSPTPLGSSQKPRTSSSLINANKETEESATLESAKGAATEIKTETKIEEIPFETKQITSSEYPSGTSQILTKGQDGQRTITYKVKFSDGVEVSRTETDNKVTEPPITEVIALGTRAQTTIRPVAATNTCDPNYVPCVPVSSVDLDCSDIKVTVQVIGSDTHEFDRDNDGVGCESYN